MPAEAQGTNEAAAKAFVRHYVDSVNHAMRTGDIEAIQRLSDQACESCTAVIANIGDLYSTGGHLEGQGWSITAIDTVPTAREAEQVVQAGVFVHRQRRYESADSEAETFQGGQQSMTFFVHQVGGSWAVKRWNQSS
jgi:hypothetical protein